MENKFRVGKKEGRAILYVETGKEYMIFPQGSEEACAEYCDYLNQKDQHLDIYPTIENVVKQTLIELKNSTGYFIDNEVRLVNLVKKHYSERVPMEQLGNLAQQIFDRNIGSNQELGYKKIENQDVMDCINDALSTPKVEPQSEDKFKMYLEKEIENLIACYGAGARTEMFKEVLAEYKRHALYPQVKYMGEEIACEMVRIFLIGLDHPNIKAYDNDYIKRNYPERIRRAIEYTETLQHIDLADQISKLHKQLPDCNLKTHLDKWFGLVQDQKFNFDYDQTMQDYKEYCLDKFGKFLPSPEREKFGIWLRTYLTAADTERLKITK